mmetsp:Transcript_14915/g.21738  ORF Transcript_14915/g.21738 Transcript_14915/m.21738 type:complete len:85 (-) Transcript_14915:35-289(-)
MYACIACLYVCMYVYHCQWGPPTACAAHATQQHSITECILSYLPYTVSHVIHTRKNMFLCVSHKFTAFCNEIQFYRMAKTHRMP